MSRQTYEIKDFWYNQPKDHAHSSVCDTVRWLDAHGYSQTGRNRHNLSMYSRSVASSYKGWFANTEQDINDRLSWNVIQSVVDAAASQMATNKPRIFNLTTEGDWAAQLRAKELNKFNDGIFYQTDQYATSRKVFKAAAIMGTGIQKIFEDDDGRVAGEYVFTDDVLVDPDEARYGDPQQMFQYREISRAKLIEKYSHKEAQIREASRDVRKDRAAPPSKGDVVSVCEAWQLPTSPDSGDGRHVIALDSTTLLDEEWRKEYFPFEFFRWQKPLLGFWGTGLGDLLTPIQIEINYILRKIQRLMTLVTTQMMNQKGNKVNIQNLTNEDMAIIQYTGTPPTVIAPRVMSPEFQEHLEVNYNKAFEISGISQMAAQSTKPAGLNSGKALDTYNDIQTKRFLEIGQEYEDFHVRVANKYADLVNDIAERGDGYIVLTKTKTGVERLSWDEVKIDRDKMISMPYPTSFLPQTPSGKWNQIQEMISAGFLSKEEAASLLDYPDLDSVTGVLNAPLDYLKRISADMLEKGKPVPVDPFTDLALAMRLLPYVIQKAENDGAPQENIDLVRRYIEEAQAIMNPPQPPAPQGQALEMAAPEAPQQAAAALPPAAQQLAMGG